MMLCRTFRTKFRADKVVYTRGSACYCLEEADNGKDLHLLRVDTRKLSSGAGHAVPGTAGEKQWMPDLAVVENFYELGHEMRFLKRGPGNAGVLYSD